MKFCKDCKHEKNRALHKGTRNYRVCSRIQGEPICVNERATGKECGPQAKLFEPKSDG